MSYMAACAWPRPSSCTMEIRKTQCFSVFQGRKE
jgi:hypothetical protein